MSIGEYKLTTSVFSNYAKIDYMSIDDEFILWLQKEMDQRGWSQSDLARESKISRQAISNIMNIMRAPGPEVCRALAKAFKVSPKSVFEKAGLLPIENKEDSELEELNYKISQLSPERQQAIKEMVDFYLTKADQEARTVLNGKGVHQH
jgi:transcriptional regulator with XRE-family HTH domain